jgi:hypothetical protein
MDEAVEVQLISSPVDSTDEIVTLPAGVTLTSTRNGRGSPAVVVTVSVTLVDEPSSSWVWAIVNDPLVPALAGLGPIACAEATATKTMTPTTERRTNAQSTPWQVPLEG